jgi:DNA-binding MarR family transcriptional regulator
VTGTQLWALSELEQHPGMSMTGLAEAMALHQSTTSNLMDKLLRRQLVRRQRDRMDSRVGHLYLTRAGERALRTAPVPARNVLLDALEHLSPERLRLLDRELTTLLQRIR